MSSRKNEERPQKANTGTSSSELNNKREIEMAGCRTGNSKRKGSGVGLVQGGRKKNERPGGKMGKMNPMGRPKPSLSAKKNRFPALQKIQKVGELWFNLTHLGKRRRNCTSIGRTLATEITLKNEGNSKKSLGGGRKEKD